MATDAKSNLVKMKSSSGIRDGSTAKTKFDSSVIKNRVVVGNSSKQSIDLKHKVSSITTTNVSKTEAKGKSIMTSSSKTKTKTTSVKTREKKVYNLPGQKFDVPEEREPLRIFYESLSKQIPSSEMAEFWMMEHGLLSPERAKKAYEKKQRRQKEIRMGTPIKSQPPSRPESSKRPQPPPPQLPSRPESSKRPQPPPPQPPSRPESSKRPQPPPPQPPSSKNGDAKQKKRVISDSDDEDDFVLSHKRRKM